jgi:hypothetical protein
MKRFVLLCAAILLAACDAAYEDVYYDVPLAEERGIALASAEELAKIGIDEAYPLDGAYYLAADIDLPEGEWTPIGSVAAPFSGVFDGNGKTIRGLHLRGGSAQYTASAQYTGLFGYLLYARLSNLTIEVENTPAILVSSVGISYTYAGAAAGYIKASSVKDVTVIGAGDGQLYMARVGNATFYAGGLAGRIENSSVSGIKVNLNLKATGGTKQYAGLVAGEIATSATASCLVAGSIEATTVGAELYAGGVAGSTEAGAQLENCVSAVTHVYAEGMASATFYVGGITGRNKAAIVSCRVESGGQVTVQGKSLYTSSGPKVYAGGISGYNDVGSIDKCLVDADIEIIAEAAGFAELYAGGIAGYQKGNISASLVRRGEVLAKAPYSGASSDTSFPVFAGGISGIIEQSYTIKKCFSNANVRAESALRSTKAFNVTILGGNVTAAGGVTGGIINTPSHIEDSGASGEVTAVSSNSEANAKTGAFAGGIAGVFVNGTNDSQKANRSIKRCAALNGTVRAESLRAKAYAYREAGGAVIGSSPYTVLGLDDTKYVTLQDDYALPGMTVQTKQGDSDWTDIDQGPNNTGNLAGSGNLELTQASLAERLGWDFETDWYWDSTANLPFPRRVVSE